MAAEAVIEGPIVSRSQLYELVWRHESKALAARLGFSGSLLSRVCSRWQIPKPERGYWQQTHAGQTIKRPALPPWPSDGGDPPVLQQNASGYGTVVPPKERAPRPKKPDVLSEMLANLADKQQSRHSQRQAALSEMIDGAGVRYLLAIEDWTAEHHLELGIMGSAVHLDDFSNVDLICRCVLPAERREQQIHVHLHFGGAVEPAEEREPELGSLDAAQARLRLQVAEDRAAFVCAALGAGKLRMLDLEVVEGRGRRHAIRWAKLCTRTHDGVEDALKSL